MRIVMYRIQGRREREREREGKEMSEIRGGNHVRTKTEQTSKNIIGYQMSASYDTPVCRALSSNPKMHGTTHPNFPLSTADAVGHGMFRIVSKSPDKDTASPPLDE